MSSPERVVARLAKAIGVIRFREEHRLEQAEYAHPADWAAFLLISSWL